MDSKDWVILETLYEEGNITKTAERLYTSQPAITYRLQQLEDEFGVKLVIRNKKGINFTLEGEYLVNYAKRNIRELKETKDFIFNLGETIQGTLRLGVSASFAQYQLPKLLNDFLQEFPNVEINLMTGYSGEIAQMIKNDDLQIGIVRGEYAWDDYSHLIFQEKISIISRDEIEIDDLPNLPQINYKTDHLLKQTIDTWWFQNYSYPPTTIMHVDKLETCKEMVKLGLGYAIVPEVCLNPHHKFVTYNLKSETGKPLIRDTWMNYREKSLELSVVKEFVKFVLNSNMKKLSIVQ